MKTIITLTHTVVLNVITFVNEIISTISIMIENYRKMQ
jgi:hypothetical protein